MRPKIISGFIEAVGNTPMIKLERISRLCDSEIYAKAEFMNPGGSVKDRAAAYMVQLAEKRRQLNPGGIVVEGTAGNTGIGLAHVCRSRGYKCVIYMPNTQSKEKIDLLKMLGADVRPVPAVPFDDPNNYNHQARRFADSTPNAIWTNQFDNTDNRDAHFATTGPEIFDQMDGNLDAFVCATGTGGSLAGVTGFLKSKDGTVKCFIADPPGSVLYSFIKSKGKLIERSGSSITEGIGQGRLTDNLAKDIDLIDDAVHVTDEESIDMVYRLLDEEGFYVGASSALNVAAAVQVGKQLPPGSKVVTLICDGAYRYQSRLFSKSWLDSKNLYKTLPKHLQKYAVLD